MGFKDQNWSPFGKEEKREEEEEEEEEEKEEEIKQAKVWNFEFCMETNLDYEFYEIWHGSLGLYDDYLAQT